MFQTLDKRYPNQILKLAAAAVAPATLLQTCTLTATAVHTNLENCSPEMLSNENWHPVFIVIYQFAGADFSFWVCVCSVYYYYYFWPTSSLGG
jgi:hypothetical protein